HWGLRTLANVNELLDKTVDAYFATGAAGAGADFQAVYNAADGAGQGRMRAKLLSLAVAAGNADVVALVTDMAAGGLNAWGLAAHLNDVLDDRVAAHYATG